MPKSLGHYLRAAAARFRARAPRLAALVSMELPVRPAPALTVTGRAASAAVMPRTVYQTWRTTAFGRSHRKALQHFRAINPDYSFRFFDDRQIEDYMASVWGHHPVHAIFQRARFGPLKTDIWRYCILQERGGIYCDIGKAVSRPLGEWVSPQAQGLISFETNRIAAADLADVSPQVLHPQLRVVNWMLGFAPGHPLLDKVIDGIVEKYDWYKGRVVKDPKAAILDFTGPLHLTHCVHAFARVHDISDIQQAGIDFYGCGNPMLAGAYVRYIGQPSYALARDCPIVD